MSDSDHSRSSELAPSREELAPLLREAAARGVAICPGCLAFLPAAIAPLPPPLDLAGGRCCGDGVVVEATGAGWFQTLTIAIPGGKPTVSQRSLTPRGAATAVAALFLLVMLTLVHAAAAAAAGLSFAVAVYLAIRLLHASTERSDERLIDLAWKRVAPSYVEKEAAARFLTRLCLTSFGRGGAMKRSSLLHLIIARARSRCQESEAELQLLAAASVLQVQDMAGYGRDVVAGIAALAAEGFVGTVPADFAEAVVASYYSREHGVGELSRLRVLLLAAAFDSGLAPGGLQDLWAGAPAQKLALAPEPAHRLGFFFGLWRIREERPWQDVGAADTVFELARTSPHRATQLLAEYPDLLLVHRLEPAIEELIGPILVCCRGVAVGGLLTADPDADVQAAAGGRALVLGRRRLDVAGELPETLARDLRRWLRFRADVLVPFLDGCLTPGSAEVLSRVLSPFCRRCLSCGTVSAVSAGAVGRAVNHMGPR